LSCIVLENPPPGGFPGGRMGNSTGGREENGAVFAVIGRFFVKKWIFAKNADLSDPAVRRQIGALSGWVGIGCNFLLFALKLTAGVLTGGISIVADALNNLSDASGSVVTLLGFRLAGKPADADHPYGHARYEYLAGLAVSVMILFIGFELAKSSVSRMIHPVNVEMTPAAVGILAVSIGAKLWLARFNRKLGLGIDSAALLAAAADSRNDCIATAGVLAAGLVEWFADVPVDGFVGMGVAVFIFASGLNQAKGTVSLILGENADPALREQIAGYIQSQPKVLGYHDLMVHDYGPGKRFATIHVEMDHREDPLVCHALIDKMERGCLRHFRVNLVVHYDPVVMEDPRQQRLREQVASWLAAWSPELSVHDFRTVQGKKHLNVLFDVSLPASMTGREAAITAMLEQRLEETEGEPVHLIVTYDVGA